jgi:hypothetical protein
MPTADAFTEAPAARRRRVLPAGPAFTGVAITFTSLYLAAGAPTPLLVLYPFGTGARGFNFYAGTLRHASFHSIATHGDGSIGIQVGGELPVLEIAGDLTTDGGAGLSLVKGVQVRLKAIALSVQAGGRIRTTGDDVLTVEIEGRLDDLQVAGGISAEGHRSAAYVSAAPDDS